MTDQILDAPQSKRKIAIIGWAGTSRDLAPWSDPEWECWALNTMGQHAPYTPHIARIFQLHTETVVRADQAEDPAYWKWLCGNKSIPVYMHHPQPEFPMAVQYPTDEIQKSFRSYFTNSVSWMIALAIHEGADVIGVWGVDMAHATEYAGQRPSCEYFLGLAEGRGIELIMPPQSDLLRSSGQYGLDEDSPLATACKTRAAEMQARLNECMNAQNANVQTIQHLQGGLEVLAYVQNTWVNPQPKE